MPTSGPLAAMYHHQAYYGPYLYQRAPASPFAASIAAAAAAQHQLPHHHSPAPSQHHYHHHHRMHADRFPSHRLGAAPSGPPPSPPGHYAPNALRASASPPANLSCKDGPAPGGSSSRGPPKPAEGPEDEEDDDEDEDEVEDAKGPNSNESQPSTSSGVTSAGGGVTSAGAQYVSANCVVFTHYSGDVSSVVDEHFSRALSLASSTSTPGGSPSTAAPAAAGSPTEAPGQIDGGMADRDKAPSPMASRNFPPSFWNSNYQLSHGPHLVLPYHPRRHDFYAPPSSSSHSEEFPSTPSTSSGAAADPWPSYQPYYHHHQPYHHHHQGGPLHPHAPLHHLLPRAPHHRLHHHAPPSAPPAASTSASSWTAQPHHGHRPHPPPAYGPPPVGLEAHSQEMSKDLYWF